MGKRQVETHDAPKRRADGGDPLGANSAVGRKLRQYYDGLVSEEVPERFIELLGRLEKAEAGKKTGEKDGESA